jgi:hypothetical protein
MNVSVKKEWLGESGYCNCLLVAMSRMRIPNIELVSDQPPPNLETLTMSRPTTCAWIRAQEFDYARLDTSEIIRILSETSGIKKSLWGYRAGTIIAHDCVEDDGPIVERTFHLRITRSGDVQRLGVNLERV